MTNKRNRLFNMQELTIIQMICEYSFAKHTDQAELFTYFNPTDINTLGFFKDTNFASQYSREFFDWVSRKDVPEFIGYEGDIKKLSESDKDELVELLDDFLKCFELEDLKQNKEVA